jgi:hypothetical protein
MSQTLSFLNRLRRLRWTGHSVVVCVDSASSEGSDRHFGISGLSLCKDLRPPDECARRHLFDLSRLTQDRALAAECVESILEQRHSRSRSNSVFSPGIPASRCRWDWDRQRA